MKIQKGEHNKGIIGGLGPETQKKYRAQVEKPALDLKKEPPSLLLRFFSGRRRCLSIRGLVVFISDSSSRSSLLKFIPHCPSSPVPITPKSVSWSCPFFFQTAFGFSFLHFFSLLLQILSKKSAPPLAFGAEKEMRKQLIHLPKGE